MRGAKKLTACPKCGAESGYDLWVRINFQGQWGERPYDTGWQSTPETVACINCGHRVSRKRAEGRDDEK